MTFEKVTYYTNFTYMKLHAVTFILLVIGGLNWLVYGLTGWEVGQLFGPMNNLVAQIVYVLVGLSAIYEVATHKKNCKPCEDSAPKM